MNISKIIFYQNDKTFEINKSFYYKYETKYPYLGYVRFKRFYSNWKLKLKKGLKPDYMNNKTVYDLLTRNNNDLVINVLIIRMNYLRKILIFINT